jgi:hypothetical protein
MRMQFAERACAEKLDAEKCKCELSHAAEAEVILSRKALQEQEALVRSLLWLVSHSMDAFVTSLSEDEAMVATLQRAAEQRESQRDLPAMLDGFLIKVNKRGMPLESKGGVPARFEQALQARLEYKRVTAAVKRVLEQYLSCITVDSKNDPADTASVARYLGLQLESLHSK